MFLGLNINQKLCIEIDDLVIKPINSVKLVGITIDSKLKFTDHVKSICTKANKKVGAFSRVVKNLDGQNAKLIYNAFIMSMFNYCIFNDQPETRSSNRSLDISILAWHNILL